MTQRSEFESIGLALIGFTCWVLTDTTIKIIGRSPLPAYEILAFLGLSISASLFVFAAARRELKRLLPRQPKRQAVRSCLDLGNNICVVIALRHLPLTLFYILVFTAPMVIALLAAVFLKERLELRKAAAIVLGFAGVVIAVNPFGTTRPGDWIGYAACAVCVACFSVNMVWSRTLTQTETAESLTLFSGVMMILAGGLCMLFRAEPLTVHLLWALVAVGLFCTTGSICFFVALKHTSAANVSQYHYTQLVTGAIVAWLLWREVPTVWMVMGATLIAASGLYIAWLAARRGGLA